MTCVVVKEGEITNIRVTKTGERARFDRAVSVCMSSGDVDQSFGDPAKVSP